MENAVTQHCFHLSLQVRFFPQECQAPETYRKAWGSEDLSLVEEDQVSKYFKKWDVHMCMVSHRDLHSEVSPVKGHRDD